MINRVTSTALRALTSPAGPRSPFEYRAQVDKSYCIHTSDQEGCKRKQRPRQAAATEPPAAFNVGGNPIERVSLFKHLGRILSDDDSAPEACVRNVERTARPK